MTDRRAIYEEFKLLSLGMGYVLCQAESLQGERWTLHAVVAPPLAGSPHVGVFAGKEFIAHTPLDPHGEFREVVRRLQVRDSVVPMTFHVPTHWRRSTKLCWRDLESGRVIGAPYHLPPTVSIADPETDPAAMLRTARTTDAVQYAFSGFDDCVKISALIRRYAPATAGKLRVLDWGVGSARVARHMRQDGRFALYGTDIDPVNLGRLWDSGYDRERFRQTLPEGSIPFDDGCFDAVFGVSVFTHLDQRLERLYLQELYRVLKPGGVAVLSVHGLVHFFSRINDGDLFFRWMEGGGFVQTGTNLDLLDGFPNSTQQPLYVDVLHSPTYVYRIWGEFFPKLDIVVAPNAYAHDLVVCRKAG